MVGDGVMIEPEMLILKFCAFLREARVPMRAKSVLFAYTLIAQVFSVQQSLIAL